MVSALAQEIGSNTEFVYKQFNEQMQKTVTEAKGEIEAFCQNKINSIALAAIAGTKKPGDIQLQNPVETKN